MKSNKNILIGLSLATSLSACAVSTYQPRPLNPDQSYPSFQDRSVATPGLREFMAAHGQTTWPVQSWGLKELTLLALYFNPELRVAQAEARVAASQVATASPQAGVTVSPRAEHHSAGAPSSPWSVGIAVEWPLTRASKRSAATEQAVQIAQAAELQAGIIGWKIRHDVRAALHARAAGEQLMQSLSEESEARRHLLQLMERRRDLGLLSGHEAAAARLKLLELEQTRSEAQTRILEATHRLADVTGLPASTVKALALSFTELDEAPPLPEQPAREALLNRLDLQRKLMEFAAADAAVKLAVARQSPDISLSPGYLWDQGDNVWSLAANLLIPSDQSALIAEAVARRELAAQSFLQLQIQVTQETETAADLVQTAREQVEILQRASEQYALKEARLTRQLEAGYADRVEQVGAQIEALTARRSLAQSRDRLQQALGSLEDVVQRPLSGFPLTRDEILNSPLARQ